ncbi:hypothetical protein LQ757_05915 [Agromyces sp. SYSU K20354]|uniref:hypothetical protein n=1 Tax=Agromyces cavernae TaxID=2898659 RepID=UPI001E4B889C|nr:hypothetical protein [Agromyces cavernae]MCD2441812.1 hypothetical protein [Agromyces cavernae]
MSRGLGKMQRRIIHALRQREEELPPLCWYEAPALGFGTTASEMSSFRRATSTLAARGEIETAHLFMEGRRSSSIHYRRNRGLVGAERTGYRQGFRRHLVVRLAPDAASHEMANVVAGSLERAIKESAGTSWARNYLDWYFRLPDGVHDEAAREPDREMATSEVMVYMDRISAAAQRARDRSARWDDLIERQRLDRERLEMERKQQG